MINIAFNTSILYKSLDGFFWDKIDHKTQYKTDIKKI